MQEAIPFRTYLPATTTGNRRLPARDSNVGGSNSSGNVVVMPGEENHVRKLVSENSVMVFGKRGCCMCHVVKKLLLGLGVNPTVVEVEEKEEDYVMKELSMINITNNDRNNGEDQYLGGKDAIGGGVEFPVVFVGGKLFGGLERVMATHISGELVPILKDAGALWL